MGWLEEGSQALLSLFPNMCLQGELLHDILYFKGLFRMKGGQEA